MTSKLNIFNSLPQHASDSDDEVNAKNAKHKVKHEKQEQRKHDHEKGNVRGQAAPRDHTEKEDISRQKNANRTKGVTADPHPQDRQSGTGHQAYGNKAKKSGAGKGNWGNYKEDRKGGEEVPEGDESPVAQEEEKPEGLTLSEYFANKKVVASGPQVNETKSKITSDQLQKELGKATALKTKLQQDIDDKRVGKKKDRLDVNHKATINSEHADLLNFRTGFVEKEYKERTRGDDQQQQPRRFGGDRKRREEEGGQAHPEGTHPEGTTNPETAQGENANAEATTAPTEGQTQTKTEGHGHGQGERKGHEGHRGGRGGYDRQRGDRGGYQGKGDRKPYAGKSGQSAKVNFEDESLFPKLG